MNNPKLSEVSARIEKCVAGRTDGMIPEDIYELYLEICIAILDSEFADYPGDELQDYLEQYLECKRRELGLPPE